MKNLKEAKELLEKYKSITLEELEEKYKKYAYVTGYHVMNAITGFGNIKDCIICHKVCSICSNCVYSFRLDVQRVSPCIDTIYREMSEALSAKELFNAIQKRISYLTHVIEWYETMDSKMLGVTSI